MRSWALGPKGWAGLDDGRGAGTTSSVHGPQVRSGSDLWRRSGRAAITEAGPPPAAAAVAARPSPARSFGQLPLILNTWPFKNATMAGAGPSRGQALRELAGAGKPPLTRGRGQEPGAGRPSAAAPPASPAPPRRGVSRAAPLPRHSFHFFLGPQRRGDSCSTPVTIFHPDLRHLWPLLRLPGACTFFCLLLFFLFLGLCPLSASAPLLSNP